MAPTRLAEAPARAECETQLPRNEPRARAEGGSCAALAGPTAADLLPQRGAHGEAMTLPFTGKKRIRRSFGKIPEAGAMPNLIEVQKSSYDQFLQNDQRSY